MTTVQVSLICTLFLCFAPQSIGWSIITIPCQRHLRLESSLTHRIPGRRGGASRCYRREKAAAPNIRSSQGLSLVHAHAAAPASSATTLFAAPFDDGIIHIISTATSPSLTLSDDAVAAVSSSPSSWRQYVPLVVCALVLSDIVLGSPAANSVLKLLQRRVDDAADANDGSGLSNLKRPTPSYKARVDVDAMVEQALAKAESVQSLSEYLEARKTDSDRIEEIRRTQDEQMARIDRTMKERET